MLLISLLALLALCEVRRCLPPAWPFIAGSSGSPGVGMLEDAMRCEPGWMSVGDVDVDTLLTGYVEGEWSMYSLRFEMD